MASSGYMGPNEVQALIGQWVDLISGEEGERGEQDRWWRKKPPWWTGSTKDWERMPEAQQRQLWQSPPQQGQQGQPGYPGGQQWPPPGYPQQPYGQPQQPPPWWQQQPQWWRQQNPWWQGMPWQPQQQPYPPQPYPGQGQPYPYPGQGQPYPYPPPQQQPYQPRPDGRIPTDPSGNYIWIPASAGRPGHWERRRAGAPAGGGYAGGGAVVRDHRGGAGGGGGVTVRPGQPRQRAGDWWSNLFSGTGTIGQWYDIAGPAVGQWYDIAGPMVGQLPPPDAFPFPARAAVVTAPMPTQANRDILPMSTGVPILPTQSAQITGRPQTLVFKIGRFVISNAGTAGGAADWIVNDIKIGNRSQFVQSGDVPGDLFAVNAIDTFVRFEAAQTAMDVVVVVTYIGLNESGAPFFGAMVGTAAV